MVGLGLIGILGAVLVGGVPAQTAVDVSPSEGFPGTQVTITQVESGPGGPCIIASATLGGQRVEVTPGDPGVASFVVPGSVAPGDQTVRATCEGGALAGSTTFRVLGGTPTTDAPPTSSDTTDPDRPAAPTTVPPEVPDVPETIAECEEQAAAAESRLVYEPERQMTVGDTYEVRAALSLDDLPPDVTFGSPTTVVVVPDARCTVEAVLSGPHFDISPDEPVAQSFVGTRVLVWEWEVSPTRAGEDRELSVRLQASVVEDGRTAPGREILSETLIDVDAAPQSLWSKISGWLRDVFGHPAVPIVIVPAVGAGYVALRRRLGHRRAPAAGAGRTHLRH